MTTDELRALQAPLKQRFREHPESALQTLRAQATVSADSLVCQVVTHTGATAAGLHPSTGGDGSAACSAEMLLQSLVGCAGVTLRAVATAMGLSIRGGTLTAEGDLDFRGTLGVERQAPVGFIAIRLRIDLDTDATHEQCQNLLRLTERYCVVFQSLSHPISISSELHGPHDSAS